MKKIKILLSILIIIPISILIVKRGDVNLEATNPISFKITSNGDIDEEVILTNDELKLTYDKGEEGVILFNGDEIIGIFEVSKNNNTRIILEFESSFLYAGILTVEDGGNLDDKIDIIDMNSMIIDLSNAHNNNVKIYKGNKTYLDHIFYNNETTLKFNIERFKQAVIEGKTSIVNSIDNPYSIEQIREKLGLIAYDDYFGDLTDDIIIASDNYTDNMNKIGVFEIEFSVTNEAGHTSSCVVLVFNRDLTSPTIIGPDSKEICYSNSNNLEDFLEYFTFSDNVDEELVTKITCGDFIPNKVGTYKINISCTDKSDNESTFNFTLKVIDKINPYFKDEALGKITINYKIEINDKLILGGLEAFDEVDGTITGSIRVVKNDLKPLIGEYEVIYEVKDKGGNTAVHTRMFTVISDDKPIFWVSKNLILIEDIYKLSIDELVNLLASYEEVIVKSYEVIKDEYSLNYNKVGKYDLEILMTSKDEDLYNIQRTIKVFNGKIEEDHKTNNIILYASLALLGVVVVVTIIQYRKR